MRTAQGAYLNASKTYKKKLSTALLLCGLSLSLPSCGEFQKEKVVTDTKIRSFTMGDAQFDLSESEIPHQYQMLVTWPNDIQKVYVEKDGKRVFETDTERKFTLPLKDNSKYVVRVFSADNDKPVLIGETQGQTPLDYTFSNPTELKENVSINANRVFLNHQTKIQTNGFNLTIQANKIYSDETEIISFPEGSKAALEQNGLPGGLVQITSNYATGNLKITLRGQDGGDGIDGALWVTRAADGNTGTSGSHDCLKGPIGGPLKCWCTAGPGRGGDGATGEKGRDGTLAGRGGNSGQIIVEIKESSDFSVIPLQLIGLAGISGKGSPGQEGGNGGAAGDPTSRECSPRDPGSKGATGEKGLDAPPVENGLLETVCVSIGQGSGKCKK